MKKKKIVSFCLSGGSIPSGKHCTLLFKPRGELRDQFIARLGEEISFEEIQILSDENVTCVVVRLEDPSLYHGPSKPHVTMEVSDGAKPVQSNDLINAMSKNDTKGIGLGYAFISAMYYDKDGKKYSASPSDWDSVA